jgi:hypothetical protein
MMIRLRQLSAAITLLLGGAGAGVAAITLASPFGEHMVLQQGVPVRIWGAGCPGGDSVGLSIAGQRVITRSDWAGNWAVELAPLKAGGPYQLLISVGGGSIVPSSAANSRGGVELNDVLVGDVWLAAGSAVPSAAQISDAGSPWIRVFKASGQRGQWALAARGTVAGQAVAAYSLARGLHERGTIPIGVIESVYAPLSPYAVRGVIWTPQSGVPTAYSGPIYESMARVSGAIRLRFRSGDGALTAKGGLLAGFLIAGEDRKFVPAVARIDGEEVVVFIPDVTNPVAVRYGYSGDAPLSLCNRAGAPAAPFRTDEWY